MKKEEERHTGKPRIYRTIGDSCNSHNKKIMARKKRKKTRVSNSMGKFRTAIESRRSTFMFGVWSVDFECVLMCADDVLVYVRMYPRKSFLIVIDYFGRFGLSPSFSFPLFSHLYICSPNFICVSLFFLSILSFFLRIALCYANIGLLWNATCHIWYFVAKSSQKYEIVTSNCFDYKLSFRPTTIL